MLLISKNKWATHPHHAMNESHRHDTILNKKYVSQEITYCWSRASTRGCGDSSLGKLCGAQTRGSEYKFSALTLKNLGMMVCACYPSARRTRICRLYEFSDKALWQKQGSKHSVRCLVPHTRGEICWGTMSQHQHLDLSSLALIPICSLTGTHEAELSLKGSCLTTGSSCYSWFWRLWNLRRQFLVCKPLGQATEVSGHGP